MVLPDILKNAPFFKKIDTKASKARSGTGKAKAAAKERTVGARPKTQIAPGPAPPSPRVGALLLHVICAHAPAHNRPPRSMR
jgi:hypothetical protein